MATRERPKNPGEAQNFGYSRHEQIVSSYNNCLLVDLQYKIIRHTEQALEEWLTWTSNYCILLNVLMQSTYISLLIDSILSAYSLQGMRENGITAPSISGIGLGYSSTMLSASGRMRSISSSSKLAHLINNSYISINTRQGSNNATRHKLPLFV